MEDKDVDVKKETSQQREEDEWLLGNVADDEDVKTEVKVETEEEEEEEEEEDVDGGGESEEGTFLAHVGKEGEGGDTVRLTLFSK